MRLGLKLGEAMRVEALTLLCFCLMCSAAPIDYTALMRQYYLLCGPEYFCLPSYKTHLWDISPNVSYRHLQVCPECKCDNVCIKRGDCCADLYFSFPDLTCVNRTIINGTYENDKSEQYLALMASSCPVESENELRMKCASLNDTKSRLRNFPVTGLQPPITFYNKYCAECNGVFNYSFWTLDIDCLYFADFNFLSTLDEVIDMAFDKNCVFQTFREDDTSGESKQESCFDIDEKQTLFTKCNQTGRWDIYDKNIAYACESFYKEKYRIFKNIFCYMCNPSGHHSSKNILSTCNLTGQWMVYDSGLQQSCIDLPMTASTFPFKNIFCYLCNRGNDASQVFVDIEAQIQEFTIDAKRFRYQYNLEIADFNLEYFIYFSKRKIEEDHSLGNLIQIPYDATSFRTKDGILINMTNLLLQKAAMRMQTSKVCRSRYSIFPKGYSSFCKCEVSCLFNPDDDFRCCEDLSLQVPIHCRDVLLNNPTNLYRAKGLPAVNGCLQESTLGIIKKGCSTPKADDIYSQIPLSKTNGIHFDNFYCVVCNLNSDQFIMKMQGYSSDTSTDELSIEKQFSSFKNQYMNNSHQYTIWRNLEILCVEYLDFSHYLTAGTLLNLAKQMKCRILIKKDIEGLKTCRLYKSDLRCAASSDWTYTDKDVEWACNNFTNFYDIYPADLLPTLPPKEYDTKPYKHYRIPNAYDNIFCALCKPRRNYPEFFIENCTLNDHSQSCYYYPRIYYYYPFKNVHCAICNNIRPLGIMGPSGGQRIKSYNRVVGKNWFPVLRNLFSISENDLTGDKTGSGLCKADQVYDQYEDVCRNITCYSGKILEGSKCTPLFGRTMNLYYSMILSTELKRGNESALNGSYLYPIEEIKELITTNLRIDIKPDVKIPKIKDLGIGCSKKRNTRCFLFELNLFFRSSVPRLLVEQSLIEFMNRFQSCCNRKVPLSSDTKPYDMRGNTKIKKRFVAEPFFFGYFSAKVSVALLCPQLELDETEYNISEDNSVLRLTRQGYGTVRFDEFALTPNGKVRVCIAYLQKIKYIPSPQTDVMVTVDEKQRYLWILSLVSSIVSIVCLLLGLIVYSLFPSLRTIPGKLIMILMLYLVLTLIFLQLSYFVVQINFGCITVALVLHFAWQSVFLCTQTANFHMWRTFTTLEVASSNSERILKKYLCYVLGLPAILICINIIVATIMYSDPFGGYGGSKCFIKNIHLLIALFIFPVAFICLTNILFFSLTALAIKRTPTASSNQKKRNDLKIFVRLTTITGLSWLFQIIDSFLPFTYFTFFSTVINSLQGMFIFFAFIVNKRVWGLIRHKFCPADGATSLKTQSTHTFKTGQNT